MSNKEDSYNIVTRYIPQIYLNKSTDIDQKTLDAFVRLTE